MVEIDDNFKFFVMHSKHVVKYNEKMCALYVKFPFICKLSFEKIEHKWNVIMFTKMFLYSYNKINLNQTVFVLFCHLNKTASGKGFPQKMSEQGRNAPLPGRSYICVNVVFLFSDTENTKVSNSNAFIIKLACYSRR